MPREAREKSIYSTYYIYQEATKRPLFKSDDEKNLFLETLKKTKAKYGFKLYAFCLQDQFYKLILFDNGNDITQIMKSINVSYTMKVNRLRNTKGQLFNQRFKSQIIDDGKKLLEWSKNIHLDVTATESIYNSYCAYFNKKNPHHLIDTEIILKGIQSDNRMKTYQMYVESETTLEHIICEYNYNECIDGQQCIQTIEEAKAFIEKELKKKKITFDTLLDNREKRNMMIRKIRQQSTLTLAEIGDIFGGISPSGICKILNKG